MKKSKSMFREKTNPFKLLMEDNDPPSTSCPIRKAHKKLREIEKLKQKTNKTPEEWSKIKEEENWKAIVCPVNMSTEETEEDILKRTQKQKEKTKTKMKQMEKKLKEQYEKHQKEIETIQGLYEEKLKLQRNIIQFLENENQQLKKKVLNKTRLNQQNKNTDLEDKIIEEYDELVQKHGSAKKAYVFMITKYHPDKFKGHPEMAHRISSILNSLKENHI